jgi:DNA-binding FadR family transcriptional regulator
LSNKCIICAIFVTLNLNSTRTTSRLKASQVLQSTQAQMARALGMDILTGRYPSGAQLPGEAELLARFQVSRTVLREVLKTLTAKGFVVSRTRVGTTVLPSTQWSLFDADVLAWRLAIGLDAGFRRDLVEIRKAIEPQAAALAAHRRTRVQLRELRNCALQLAAGKHTRRSYAEADVALHLAVVAASGNSLMRSIASVIEAALMAAMELSSAVDEPAVHAESVARHTAIVDAIEAGNSKAAAAAMLAVIETGALRVEHATVAQQQSRRKKPRLRR